MNTHLDRVARIRFLAGMTIAMVFVILLAWMGPTP